MKQRILTGFADFRDVTETGLDTVEHTFLLLATRAAPWLAPAGPAILIYRSLQHRLGVNPYAAGAMGLAVELVGIATAHLTVNCWQWNQQRRKSDPAAPTKWAASMTAAYLAGAVAVSTLLEVLPAFAPYAPIVFFILAACAYGSLALGSQLTRWEQQRRAETAARHSSHELRATVEKLTDQAAKSAAETAKLRTDNERLQQQLASLKAAQKVANSEKSMLNNGNPAYPIDQARAAKADKVTTRRARIAALLADDPGLSNADLARLLGVSADTIRRDRGAMESDGPEVVDVLRDVVGDLNRAVNGNGRHA